MNAHETLIIRGDRVVLPDGIRPAAIHIHDGRITAVTSPTERAGRADADRELDAGPLVNGNRTWLVGTPQVEGPGHADQCRLLGNNAAAVGDAEYVVYNRSLRTGTGIDANNLVVIVDGQVINVSGWRADVLVVRRGPDGKPRIDLYEVQSPPPGQQFEELEIKPRQMMEALPPNIQGNWQVIRYPY